MQLPSLLSDATKNEESLKKFLNGLSGVDKVGVEERAAKLATRSIKTTAKKEGIDLSIRMIDLTTLEGMDTKGKVKTLCAKARRPDPLDNSVPSVAAVCVYSDLVSIAKENLTGTNIKVAAVATGFPAGRVSLAAKLQDTNDAVSQGADEIDMVIDRGAFHEGRFFDIYEQILTIKEACKSAHLKVILETGELKTYDNVKKASWIAMLAGADFIKTSTGKVQPAATLPVTLVMLQAINEFERATGKIIGMKPAGGIKTTKDAMKYLVLVKETLGDRWLSPDLFRFGASSLLNDLLMQRQKLKTGAYSGPDYVTVD
ncbi:MAG: deoxyribose-phosphate aldolase [Candidatus Nanopelagicales bacterium]|jgi:deoxyribose-phosphate aldolase|nr:deoxyribose-phosphate aldolase [Actinomycetota bacterium]